MKAILILIIAAATLVVPVQAETVMVEATGTVEWNQVRFGTFADVNAGDPVTMSFQLDSDEFLDSSFYPTRGYGIDLTSYSLTLGSVTIGLYDPWPAGQTPYFVLRDNDPAVDGFFVATNNVDWPWPGLFLDEWGRLDIFTSHLEVGYTGDTLSSLDILDALGTYSYDGLTNFYFTVNDDGFEPIGIDFTQMTISLLPVEVPVDIKPGSCRNPLNATSDGVLPVAILGTGELDVSTIDPASIRLAGVAPLRSGYEDVGTPFMPFVGKQECEVDCNEMEADGWTDLTLKFSTQQIAAAMGDPVNGECAVLTLTGYFYDGGPIVGEDLVVIVKERGGNRREVTPADRTSHPMPTTQPSEGPVQIRRRD